jgi:hypothetical protein
VCVRGASALQGLLDGHEDLPLRVYVVWEPVLFSDIAPPTSRTLRRIHDARVAQFWDADRVLSADILRAVRADPSRYSLQEELPEEFVLWDVVAAFPRGSRWDADLPVPFQYGGPVVDAIPSLRAALSAEGAGSTGPPGPAAAAAQEPPDILGTLREEAARLRPFATSALAREFLDRVAVLPAPEARVILRAPAGGTFHSEQAAAGLPEAARAALERLEIDPATYYTTKYGSPLAYVRAVDLLGTNGVAALAGKRIADFGYGSVGQLRLMAAMGADVVGVDVDPYLSALYSRPEDQGTQANPAGPAGRVRLADGRWPATPAVREAVGRGLDLFLSKNTLKRGYLRPEREADPRRLLHLGVDEEAFVRAVFEALAPGGTLLIYNLSPPQNPPDKPYLPWADGRCAFARDLLEKVGFRVILYDEDDGPAAREMGRLLRWDEEGMDLENGLFAHATLARKPDGPR